MAKNEDVSVDIARTGEAHVPHAKYEKLIASAKQVQRVVTIVAHPCDETSLRGATAAAEAGIIVPVLVSGLLRRSGPSLGASDSTSAGSKSSTCRTAVPRQRKWCCSFAKAKASS